MKYKFDPETFFWDIEEECWAMTVPGGCVRVPDYAIDFGDYLFKWEPNEDGIDCPVCVGSASDKQSPEDTL